MRQVADPGFPMAVARSFRVEDHEALGLVLAGPRRPRVAGAAIDAVPLLGVSSAARAAPIRPSSAPPRS